MRRSFVVVVLIVVAAAVAVPARADWETPTVLDARAFSPEVAANPQGDALVLWTVAAGGPVGGRGWAAAFSKGGRAFGPPQRLADGEGYFRDVAVAANGDAFVAIQIGDTVHTGYRPAGGRFASLRPLPGAGQHFELEAAPRGDDVLIASAGPAGVRVWRHDRDGRFIDTGMRVPAAVETPGLAIGRERTLLAWSSGGRLNVAELRGNAVDTPQVVAEHDYVSVGRLAMNARGDALLRFSTLDGASGAPLPRVAAARPGAAFIEVPARLAIAPDGTRAVLRAPEGPITLTPLRGPALDLGLPAGFGPDRHPSVGFDPDGRLRASIAEPPRRPGPSRTISARRDPAGGWCAARPWPPHPTSGFQVVGEGDAAIAVWQRIPSSEVHVARFRAADGCVAAARLPAPRALRATVRGRRVVASWRHIPGAVRYRVIVRVGRERRRVEVSAPRRSVVIRLRRAVRSGAVRVTGVGQGGRPGRSTSRRLRLRS